MKDAVKEPEFVVSDFAKIERFPAILLGFIALSMFKTKYERFPRPRCPEDASEFLAVCNEYAQKEATFNVRIQKE